jgi:two-component system, chemotaxis family, protein-glutamate methylesterase/glutaminase
MRPIRLLIVDDSVFMRKAYDRFLNIKEINIVAMAKNGKEGVEKTIELKPDIVIMDIEMPVMNGLDALDIIMKSVPTPVLMVSSQTNEGAEATLDALQRGAIDFVAKENSFIHAGDMQDEIISKIITIGRNSKIKNKVLRRSLMKKDSPEGKTKNSEVMKPSKPPKKKSTIKNERPSPGEIDALTIGISTGGPLALQALIPKLPANFPVPIFIIQHMPPNFTKSLASRLNALSALSVKEAEDGDEHKAGNVYIAPGGKQMLVGVSSIKIREHKPEDKLYKPSFDVALKHLNKVYGRKLLALIMTGMGHDGAIGLKKLNENGGYCIGQEPSTCVVSGMVNSAEKVGAVDEMCELDKIAKLLIQIFKL